MALSTHYLGFILVLIVFVAFAFAWSRYVDRRDAGESASEPPQEAAENGGEG